MRTNRIIFLITALACLSVISCDTQTETKVVEPNLSVGGLNGNSVEVDATFCGGVAITVESNVDWTSSSNADSWVELSPSCGKGGEFYEAEIYFKDSNYSDARNAEILITAADKSFAINVTQKGYDPTGQGFDNPEKLIDGHPFLLASGEDFTKIRKMAVQGGSIQNVIHRYIMRYADKAIELSAVKFEISGGRLLNVCSEALKRVFYLSYAYRFTGDPKYATSAEKEMLAICSFPNWNPSNFIEPAEMMMTLAVGYDWCYPRLSKTTRQTILEAIKTKGLDPYFEWPGARNNFNQVCNTGALYASYIYKEKDETVYDEVEARALDMIKLAMGGYEPDGTYVEGPGYWCYGTAYNTLMLDLLQRKYGDTRGLLEEFPSFLKTGDYANAVITPSFRVFEYSDQGFDAQISIVPFYIYDLTGNTSVLGVQKKLLERSILNLTHCRHERLLPAALVYAARRGLDNISDSEPPKAFVGAGETPFASFRGSSYLGIKLGRPKTGHGHMDIGTFCFEANDVQWSTDMGGEAYSSIESAGVDIWSYEQGSERWSLTRCGPRGHSILSFDGKEQIVTERADFTTQNTDNDSDLSVEADLSALYSDSVDGVTRKIRLINGRDAEICDEIKVGEKTVKLRWQMVTEAVEAVLDANGANLKAANGSRLRMDVEGLDGFIMEQQKATPLLKCESANSEIIVAFSATLDAKKNYKIKVKLTPNIE